MRIIRFEHLTFKTIKNMADLKKITGLVTGALAVLPLAGSSIPKLFLAKPGTEFYQNFEHLGFHEFLVPLGLIDIAIAVLVLFPRTSLVGTIAAFAYWSGAMATELTHGVYNAVPAIAMTLLVISAWFRTPEAFDRLLGRSA